MQRPPPYRHEEKVIINVRRNETGRNSEPTIVNMPIPKEHRSAMRKTRIAVGAAMGVLAVGAGVILAKDLTGRTVEKTSAPSADTAHQAVTDTPPSNILVATAAPSVEDSTEAPEENPTPAATATATPDLPKTASVLPVPATGAPVSPSTATAKTWASPKPQPLPKSGIIREVPF